MKSRNAQTMCPERRTHCADQQLIVSAREQRDGRINASLNEPHTAVCGVLRRLRSASMHDNDAIVVWPRSASSASPLRCRSLKSAEQGRQSPRAAVTALFLATHKRRKLFRTDWRPLLTVAFRTGRTQHLRYVRDIPLYAYLFKISCVTATLNLIRTSFG